MDSDPLKSPDTVKSIKQERIFPDDDASPSVDDNNSQDGTPTLSKRAMKRKMKAEKWTKTKHIKRAQERQNKKLRNEAAKEMGIILEKTSRKALKKATMSTSRCKLRVVLDFSFDSKMIPKDIDRLVNQALRVYSANRRVKNPLQVFATSFTGKSSSVISKHDGHRHWDIHFKAVDYSELFKKEELVYLTSDSENVIRELDPGKVYIIGALVDHNSLKGECYKKALSQGIQHGRLPLDDHVTMKTRKVLTVDQVFSIIALVAGNDMSWAEAILKIIPLRKGAVAKDTSIKESLEARKMRSLLLEPNEDNSITMMEGIHKVDDSTSTTESDGATLVKKEETPTETKVNDAAMVVKTEETPAETKVNDAPTVAKTGETPTETILDET